MIDRQPDDKPTVLKAIELILAEPKEIKKEVNALLIQYHNKYDSKKNSEEISDMIARHLISNYSYITAFTGAATSLTSVIPGLGQVVAVCGGSSADAALCMKYQIELTMALATVYDHDICVEEEKRLCFIIAGLGATSQALKESGKAIGSKTFIKMVQQYLQGETLVMIKEIFKKISVTFTRKALEKAAPFGISLIISASANKTLTWYIGNKALDFFKAYDSSWKPQED